MDLLGGGTCEHMNGQRKRERNTDLNTCRLTEDVFFTDVLLNIYLQFNRKCFLTNLTLTMYSIFCDVNNSQII